MKKKPKRRRWLRVLSVLNILLVIGDWLVVDAFGDRTGISTVLVMLPQVPVFVPSVAILLICLATVQWRLLLGNLVAIVPFAWVLLGMEVNPNPPAAKGQTLKVLTFNAHHGSAGWANVAMVVLDQHPDVFCLQEMNGVEDSDIASLLRPYRVVHRGEFVLGSRWPLTDVVYRNGNLRTARTLQAKTAGTTLQTTHFASFDNWRALVRPNRRVIGKSEHVLAHHVDEADDLVRLDESVSPLVLCGDFNNPPRGTAYRTLQKAFFDAFDSAGNGFGYTHPSVFPFQRIDYILYRGAIATDCRPVSSNVSDHMPVVATLTVSTR